MSGVSSSKVVFTLRSKGFLLPDFLGFTTRLASDHGGRELQQHESASVSRRRPSSWIRTLTLNAWSWCGLCRISSREWCYCMMVSRAMPRLSSYTESRRGSYRSTGRRQSRFGKLPRVFDEYVRIYSSPYMLQRERVLRQPNPADAFPQPCPRTASLG